MGLNEIAIKLCDLHNMTLQKFQGSGAFKEVYHVKSSNKDFALKIFNRNLQLERQNREIDAILKCSHSNIAKIISSDKIAHQGTEFLYCIEEFLQHGTLAEKRATDFCIDRLLKLVFTLVSALDHLKSLELVHRDLKPENIMFRDENTPVITDFGLVRDLTKTGLTYSWMPHGPGTPFYSSPEQLNNNKEIIDWRSDQFSVGVMISILAFNVHPYGCTAEPLNETVFNVQERKHLSCNFIKNECHPLYPILSKMVQPWPFQRYRKPESIIQELKKQIEN